MYGDCYLGKGIQPGALHHASTASITNNEIRKRKGMMGWGKEKVGSISGRDDKHTKEKSKGRRTERKKQAL